jgi:hypothetical protein
MANHGTVFKSVTFHRTGDYVAMFVIIACCISSVIAGWKTLNRITPAVFLFLPLLGWVVYFIIKLVLALLCGACPVSGADAVRPVQAVQVEEIRFRLSNIYLRLFVY